MTDTTAAAFNSMGSKIGEHSLVRNRMCLYKAYDDRTQYQGTMQKFNSTISGFGGPPPGGDQFYPFGLALSTAFHRRGCASGAVVSV